MYYPVYSRRMRCISNRLARSLASHPAAIEDVIAASEAAIAAAAPQSAEDVRTAGRTLIVFSPAMALEVKGLQRFLFERVYRSEAVMAPVRRSEALVAALFDRYLTEGGMPARWDAAAAAAPDLAARARVVADFVAGMTDPYAVDEYTRLFDARPEFR